MTLCDPTILDNSEPTPVARVSTREDEYLERSRDQRATYMREWAERNREHLKAYKREYNQRPEPRKRRLRYGREYSQRLEVIEANRRRKAFSNRPDSNWRTVSLDAATEHTGRITMSNPLSFHEQIGSKADDPLLLLAGRPKEMQDILGGLTEEDIGHLSEHDLMRLRERILDAGLAPSTQHAERARQRQLGAGR